eukprot:s2087_g5.t1
MGEEEEEAVKKNWNVKDVVFNNSITIHIKLNYKEPSANTLSAMKHMEVEGAEVEEIEESEVEEEEWGEMMVQQHWAMSKLTGQEMALIDGIDADQRIWMKTLTILHEERGKLEDEILERKQDEILQGYTVSNQQASEENNMWLIKEVGGDGSPCGYLATYVDDMLMVGPQPLLQALMTTIGNKWECSSQEFAEPGKDFRFCGVEIRKTPQGFDIHQSSYVMDLLARYEVAKTDVPMGKVDDLDEEEEEKKALKIGEQVLAYLNKYSTLGISYLPCEPTEMDENQVPRMMDTAEVFADVSYAPGGEAYRSIQGVLTTMGGQIIQWHTGRQSLIATSTAEGELLAYQEGQIMGASVEALAQAMALDPDILMHGDNKAAISLTVLQIGSRHMAGTLLVADGLTKALQRQAFEDFIKKLKMSASDRPVLNKLEKGDDGSNKPTDMLYCNHQNEVYYKKMMATALAAFPLLLTGELHIAAVVLLALKCCQKTYGDLYRRSPAPRPEEESEAAEKLPPNVKHFTEEKPRGDDRWYPIQPGGWLIRKHGQHRQKCFHPLHRSGPVDSIRFKPVRFTVVFYEEGGRSKRRVLKDDWTGAPTVIDYGEWKGYTVFKLKDQPDIAPTQLDPEEPAPSNENSRAADHVPCCNGEEESPACGHMISGVGDKAPAHSTAFPETGQAAAASGISLRPQPKPALQGAGDLEEVMRGLQLLGRQYPHAGGEQPCPDLPRFGHVQGAAPVQGAAQVQSAAQLRDAAQQQRADQLQRGDRALLCGQARFCGSAEDESTSPPPPPPTGWLTEDVYVNGIGIERSCPYTNDDVNGLKFDDAKDGFYGDKFNYKAKKGPTTTTRSVVDHNPRGEGAEKRK